MEDVRKELEATKAPALSVRTLARKTGLKLKAVSAICHQNFKKADPAVCGSGKYINNSRCFTVI